MRRVRATYSTVAKLVSSHDVVLLQETHGSDADLASLRLRFIRHLVFGSFTVGHHGGGVVFIVDPAFAELYSGNAVRPIRMVDIIPGRLAKIIFPNTLKMASLEVVNIHLEVEVTTGTTAATSTSRRMLTTPTKAIAEDCGKMILATLTVWCPPFESDRPLYRSTALPRTGRRETPQLLNRARTSNCQK